MTRKRREGPPRLPRRLLRACLPDGLSGASLLGDLHEEFLRIQDGYGRGRACRWYWRESLGLAGRYLWVRITHPGQLPGPTQGGEDLRSRAQSPQKAGFLMELLTGDLRRTVRNLLRRPTLTLTAILTLGIGIGAVTSIYSVVQGVLLRPLPYEDSKGLVFLSERNDQDPDLSPSFPNYLDWREENESFQDLAVFTDAELTLTGQGDPVRLEGWVTSASLFPLLGVEASLGRTFLEEEDRAGAPPVVLLSHGLWTERFGRDAAVLGRSVELAGQPWTVVGVMPPDFSFPPPSPRFGFLDSDFWVPMGPVAGRWTELRDLHPGLSVLGRLQAGVTIEQARSDMDLLALGLEEEYPEANAGQRVNVRSAAEVVVEDVRTPILLLLSAGCFLLLIACVNVANLQMARATDRAREFAMMASLGAGRGSLVRLVLLETFLLSFAGGALGLLLARGSQGLFAFAAHALGSRADQIELGLGVLILSAGITLLTGILAGLLPAWMAGSVGSAGMLRVHGGGRGVGYRRVHSVLMTTEIAFALMLLVGAGLMIRSFSSLIRTDTGLASENLLSMQLSLSSRGGYYDAVGRTEFFHRVVEEGRTLPGVSAVGAIYPQPLGMSRNAVPYEVDGETPPPPGEYLMAEYSYVSGGYFGAVGAPLLQGRDFDARDGSEDRPVVIVDESFAQRHWPGESAVGKRIRTAGWQKDVPWLEIVGVVGHIRIFGAAGESWVQMYVPFESVQPTDMAIMVRAREGTSRLTEDLRSLVKRLDPDLPVTSIRTMESYLADTTASQRLWALILGILSGVSLLLAGIGVYGVVSYSVSRRNREMGIRVALGARAEGILGQVLREGLKLTLFGILLGAALALALSRLMAALLFGVTTSDPPTYLLVGLLLLLVSCIACGLPALRAARLDPVEVLREE